ncbi:SH3 domain-containing protein [Vibrio sp. PP-XX7]
MRKKVLLVTMLGVCSSFAIQAEACEQGKVCDQLPTSANTTPATTVATSSHKALPAKTTQSHVMAHKAKNETKHASTQKVVHKKAQQLGTYIVTAKDLNVRSKPSRSSVVTGKLHHGEKITVHTFVKGWAKVSFHGHEEWVSGKYLSPYEKLSSDHLSDLAS